MSDPQVAVAYICHWFPALSERYVPRQIDALRARGLGVLVIAVKQPQRAGFLREAGQYADECTYVTPLKPLTLIYALVDCLRATWSLRDIYARVLWGGSEHVWRRLNALLHTWLGAYVARVLRGRVTHIHANHGYFPAWAAMIASRLIGVPYTLTLHGSDLLVDAIYIDLKTRHAQCVITVSEYNKHYLLRIVPGLSPAQVIVNRLGIETDTLRARPIRGRQEGRPFALLTVGRLHHVKNIGFLLQACRQLADDGFDFRCRIVGTGPEWKVIAAQIARLGLLDRVVMLGSMPYNKVACEYEAADLFVLTSHSEGLPNVLVEAMLHGLPVLAPAITGIPELIADGYTGALYRPNDLGDLVARIRAASSISAMERIGQCQRARARVLAEYNGTVNAGAFAALFDADTAMPFAGAGHSGR